MAVEVRFGYVESEKASKNGYQYMAFNIESAHSPLCDDCTIAYIKEEEVGAIKV